MKINYSKGYGIFSFFNYILLVIVALTCIFPLVHEISVSLSAFEPVEKNTVGLLPIGLNLKAYINIIRDQFFLKSFDISIYRVLLGTSLSMILTFFMAYPLSRDVRKFPSRNIYIWLIVFCMLFNGGLVPTFMVVKRLGLMNSIWALVLPVAVNSFYVILLVNFFRELPKELEESAFIDGAGHFVSLFKIYIPLSIPIIGTLVLFNVVYHWNSWFDGLLYMDDSTRYPLQSYLQLLLERAKQGTITIEMKKGQTDISPRSIYASEMVVAIIPLIIIYPIMQKYFTTGIILGSVKG